MNPAPMPAVFIGHGSPMNALEDNPHTRAWRGLGAAMPTPRAILAISAHWTTQGTRITATNQPGTIHDFYGFPPELYQCKYPASGDEQLARHIQQLLKPIDVKLGCEWGLDHGTWSVLMQMYPRANIPTLQLSIDTSQPHEFHYRLGRQLGALRDSGVLILGSGNVVHNLRQLRWDENAAPYPWAISFNDKVRTIIAQRDHDKLAAYETFGEDAQLSVPSTDHFLPLLYVAGASRPQDKVSFPTDGIELGAISMLSALYSL